MNQTKVLTAGSVDELDKKVRALVADIVEQGWHTEGGIVSNADKTYSQKMVRNVK